MSEELGPGMLKAMERIQKLLNKANDKSIPPAEAALFAAKAQEELTRYNLDAATVEKHGGGAADGRREEAKTRGGFYQWQRELWTAVARLNFCLYWTQSYWDKEWKGRQRLTERQQYYNDAKSREVTGKMQKRHRIIGRIVNTRTTISMALYLEEAIERMARESIRGDMKQLYSREANSFRYGAMEEVVDKLNERYRDRISKERAVEEKKRHAAHAAAAAGHSTSTAVTIAEFTKSEKEANMDFLHGEPGYTARIAREEAEEEARYTQWCAENPEEARKEQEAAEKAANRSRGGGTRENTIKVDWSAYQRGKQAGAKISIDQQVDSGSSQKRLK